MTGQPSPIEQWALNFLATHPDPGLTPGRYAVGVAIMCLFIFAGIVVIGDVVAVVSPRMGKLIIALSLPVTPIIGLAIWWFIT